MYDLQDLELIKTSFLPLTEAQYMGLSRVEHWIRVRKTPLPRGYHNTVYQFIRQIRQNCMNNSKPCPWDQDGKRIEVTPSDLAGLAAKSSDRMAVARAAKQAKHAATP